MNKRERKARKEAIKQRLAELEREGGWRFALSYQGEVVAEGDPLQFWDAISREIGPHRMNLDIHWTRAA